MLHTKFRENLPVCSGEEDFWRVFTIYGRGGHLGYVTQMPRTNFHSPSPRRLHIKFGFDWPRGFGEEDLWALWTTTDGRTTDGRRTMSILWAHLWAFGSGELKCIPILDVFVHKKESYRRWKFWIALQQVNGKVRGNPNQRTNGLVNAYLISGPGISINYTKPD